MAYIEPQQCAGTRYENGWPRACMNKGSIEEQGKRWCSHHAPSSVAKRREERNDRLRGYTALVARQRRMAQRAEAVRIVLAYLKWANIYASMVPDADDFAAFLYPEPKEAE